MRDLKKQERSALEAVARRFGATWEQGFITVDGKRIAVEITTLKERGTAKANAAKPRLRFDKVVAWLMQRLQVTLANTVPDGTTVVLTVTASIRLASKTAASLEDKIQTVLDRRSPGRDEKCTIHGNRVRIRLVKGKSERAPKLIGFVHNPDSDPLLLLNMTSELLERITAQASRRTPRPAGDRWLVVISARGISCLDAYRYIHSQVRNATGFNRILMVFGDGRVGMLTD